MRRFTFLSSLSLALAALFLSGCGQPKVAGVYKTIGSEDKFQMTLELQEGGKARLSTKTNLGSKALDDTTSATLSIPDGRWTATKEAVIVTGTLGGKPAEHRFLIAPTGELFWEKNGAKFSRQ